MGLPVTVYRSTDAGAPQLVTGKPSSWINVLKKVLVEGYGVKSPLGWTVEFEDVGTRSIVFRNSLTDGGSGCYVKFYSVGGSDNNYTVLGVKLAQSFTDINTFIKGLGARGISNSSGYNDWEIIGTSRGFYVTLYGSSDPMGLPNTNNITTQCYFIGDIEPHTPNDTSPFTIVNSTNATGDNTASSGLNVTGNTLYAQLNSADGTSGNNLYSFSKSNFYQQANTPTGNAEQLGINHLMSPVAIYGTPASSQNTSFALPYMRGNVPGLHTSSFAGYRTETWPYDVTQNSITWVLLKCNSSPQQWIKTGTWYD